MDENFLKKLDLLKKQIKFGRVVEARQGLIEIINRDDNLEHVSNALKTLVYSVELPASRHEEAGVLLKKIVDLNFSKEDVIQAQKALIEIKKNILPTFEGAQKELDIFLNFLNSNLFDFNTPSKDALHFDFIIVEKNIAIKLAHNQNIERPYASWNSFRSHAAKNSMDFFYKNKINLDFFEKIGDLWPIAEKVATGEMSYFLDDVHGDLTEIARSTYLGKKWPIHEKMKNAYMANFFPCGIKKMGDKEIICLYNPNIFH